MDEREWREDRADARRAQKILKQALAADPATQVRHTIGAVTVALNAAARRPYCPWRDCTNSNHVHASHS